MGNHVTIEGMQPTHQSSVDENLVTYLLAIELPNYFSLYSNDPRLEALLKSLHNKANSERIKEISQQIKKGLLEERRVPHLSLTYAVGKARVVSKNRNGLSKISFDSQDTLIVNGVLELVAIAKLLGIEHPFEPTRKLSKQDVISNTKVRQALAQAQIQVTLIFNREKGLSSDNMLSYFHGYSVRDSKLHSPILTGLLSRSLINEYIDDLAKEIDLDSFGGITRSSLRLTKSDHGIVAEATLIKLVLGAIGGATPQNSNKVEDFNSKTGAFSEETVQQAKPHIASFLDIWLSGTKEQFENDRDGFHYSPSIWLALGLVINKIIMSNERPFGDSHLLSQDIENAAFKLSQLDYSKSAKHWENCEVMELDAKGKNYKNASSGGRSFRTGIASYLNELATQRK